MYLAALKFYHIGEVVFIDFYLVQKKFFYRLDIVRFVSLSLIID